MADPDLPIRWVGGGGGGLGSHPDPEISGEARSPKRFVRPFRPQFGLSKNKGGVGGGVGGGSAGASPGSATEFY